MTEKHKYKIQNTLHPGWMCKWSFFSGSFFKIHVNW